MLQKFLNVVGITVVGCMFLGMISGWNWENLIRWFYLAIFGVVLLGLLWLIAIVHENLKLRHIPSRSQPVWRGMDTAEFLFSMLLGVSSVVGILWLITIICIALFD